MPSDLLHRLTTATAGSRELDSEVGMTLGWRPYWANWYSPETAKEARRKKRGLTAYDPTPLPFFTTDLNATFAEAQRLGLAIAISTYEAIRAQCGDKQHGEFRYYEAATPALAACAALIAEIGDQP